MRISSSWAENRFLGIATQEKSDGRMAIAYNEANYHYRDFSIDASGVEFKSGYSGLDGRYTNKTYCQPYKIYGTNADFTSLLD